MTQAVNLINDNGTVYAVVGLTGHCLGPLADMRRTLRQVMDDVEPRDLLRAIARRLIAAGLDPRTATLAQIKAAIEGSEVDA